MNGIRSAWNVTGTVSSAKSTMNRNVCNEKKNVHSNYRKEARLVVDGSLKAEVREPPGPVRALYLTSEMVIGATIDYRDGFVGCIRALLLNGQLVDLKSYARRGLYGVSSDCQGRCESSPCLNNGTCHERYDGYTCDCRWSAFKGPICADGLYFPIARLSFRTITFW